MADPGEHVCQVSVTELHRKPKQRHISTRPACLYRAACIDVFPLNIHVASALHPELFRVWAPLCSKVKGSSSATAAAAAAARLSGATLSTLAQQHACITEHVLGVIQCASVYSGAVARPSPGTFRLLCRYASIWWLRRRLPLDADLTLLICRRP